MGYMIRKKTQTQSLQGLFIYWCRSNVVMKTTFLLYGKIGWKKCITKCRLNFMIDVLHCIKFFFMVGNDMRMQNFIKISRWEVSDMSSSWESFNTLLLRTDQYFPKYVWLKFFSWLFVFYLVPSTYRYSIHKVFIQGEIGKGSDINHNVEKKFRLICQNHVSRTSTKL